MLGTERSGRGSGTDGRVGACELLLSSLRCWVCVCAWMPFLHGFRGGLVGVWSVYLNGLDFPSGDFVCWALVGFVKVF